MTESVLRGRITRLAGAYENDVVAIRFRIGSISCRATGDIANQLAAHAGYMGHEVEVVGQLVGKVLDISKLLLID